MEKWCFQRAKADLVYTPASTFRQSAKVLGARMQQAFTWGLDALSRWGGAAARDGIKTVATVGAFDGLHRGHAQILRRIRDLAAQNESLKSAVVIFEPLPQEFFAKGHKPARLMSLRDKVSSLHEIGVDIVVCLRFNARLRHLTALEFLREVLLEGLRIQHLEIGDDFRFGCDRQGDFTMLQTASVDAGFSLNSSHTFEEAGERISSTRIREVLAANAFAEAERLLGRPYSIAGRVIYGRQLGRTLDVPTANIRLRHASALQPGVYAVSASLEGQSLRLLGVANLGVKPTVDSGNKLSLEVHLFNFSQNIYGKCLRIYFHMFIRAERTFGSVEMLKFQILRDCQQAKDYFQRPGR